MSVLMHAIRKHLAYYLNFPIGQKLNMGQFWNLVVKVCDVNTPVCVSSASCSAPQTLQASLVRSWVDWDARPRAERVTSCLRKAYLTRVPRWKDISFQWVTARRSVGCVYSAALRMWTYAIQLFVFPPDFWRFKSIWQSHPLGLLQFSLNTNEEQMTEYECQYLIQHILI